MYTRTGILIITTSTFFGVIRFLPRNFKRKAPPDENLYINKAKSPKISIFLWQWSVFKVLPYSKLLTIFRIKKLNFTMCQTAICGLCNKKSWTGCGAHIPSVMDNTDKKLWCTCRHNHIDDKTNTNYPPKAGTGRTSM